MEIEISLQYSQVPATRPYPENAEGWSAKSSESKRDKVKEKV